MSIFGCCFPLRSVTQNPTASASAVQASATASEQKSVAAGPLQNTEPKKEENPEASKEEQKGREITPVLVNRFESYRESRNQTSDAQRKLSAARKQAAPEEVIADAQKKVTAARRATSQARLKLIQVQPSKSNAAHNPLPRANSARFLPPTPTRSPVGSPDAQHFAPGSPPLSPLGVGSRASVTSVSPATKPLLTPLPAPVLRTFG